MALGAIFILIRKINQLFATEGFSKEDAATMLNSLVQINSVLAIFEFNPANSGIEDPGIEMQVSRREEARERGDYEEADRIREDLRSRNVTLEDTPYGTVYWTENRKA
jgi:cysteinyl-tRNA synthetase